MALLFFGLSRCLARDLLGVLEAMHAAVVRFAAGDLTARAPARGVREIADLGRAFNETADALTRWKCGAIAFQLGIATQLRDPLTVIKLRLRAPEKDGDAPARSRAIEEQVRRLDLMIRDLIDLFGCDRLMIGSNAPVDLIMASYAQIVARFDAAIAHLLETDRRKLWHDTAARIYRIAGDA